MNNTQPTDKDELKQQTEQARRVLMRLQWLVIVLLGSGIIWLYVAFESVVGRVDERLAKIDGLDTRLNDMDDRIFAITPAHPQDTSPALDSTPKNDQLIYIELGLANQLYEQGNYHDALTTLHVIRWQLPQTDGLASPIKSALTQSLDSDITHLNTLKNQPDAWQDYLIKIQEVQSFLKNQQSNRTTLDRTDLLLHDAIIFLSLANGSATMRNQAQTHTYLNEAKDYLESHLALSGHRTNIDNNTPKPTTLNTLDDALYRLYELLANRPKDEPLQSVQLLKNPS